MIFSDSPSLKFWEVFATIGFALVLLGVVIEGVEHFVKFKKGEAKRRHLIEKIGWFILVGGLSMELLGDQMAKRISRRQNAELEREAGDARKDAAEAMKQTEGLRSNNLVLTIQLEEIRKGKVSLNRIISKEGSNFLTSALRSIAPLNVEIARSLYLGNEGWTLADQIRDIFTNAGCNVKYVVSPQRTYGVACIWNESKYSAGDFETNGLVRVNITDRIAKELGQQDVHEFLGWTTNFSGDLKILVGQRTLF